MIFPTVHFKERWQERVSEILPSVEELNEAISESVRLQPQRDLFTPRGRRYRVLAIYWNPKRKIVFKVDHKECKAVTVLAPATAEEDRCKMIAW